MIKRRVIRGDTDNFIVRFDRVSIDEYCIESNVPMDILGWEVRFTVRKDIPATDVIDDTGAVISKLGVISDTDIGVCVFNLTKEDTNIEPGEYWFDIQFIKPDGSVKSIPKGKYIVYSDITRDEDW